MLEDRISLGFFTACLPQLDLLPIATWAAAAGFSALEIAAWPVGDPTNPSHLDPRTLDGAATRRLQESFAELGLEISSLGCYLNNLDADRRARSAAHSHLHALIDAAARLGVPTVGTFIGRDVSRSVADNVRAAPEAFTPLLEHAEESGVRLVVENCLMASWHPDGYPANLAYSPELWDWMLDLGFALNFDPSHLLTIGIDPAQALEPYVPHVAHVQAKDVELRPERIARYGYFGRAIDRSDPAQRNIWTYRLPGDGSVNWTRLLEVLQQGGYRGVISIEHEDPHADGGPAAVKRGLEGARTHLASALAAVQSQPLS